MASIRLANEAHLVVIKFQQNNITPQSICLYYEHDGKKRIMFIIVAIDCILHKSLSFFHSKLPGHNEMI